MIVIESNQNHATVKDTEVCNTLPSAMGAGGGYVPMILQKCFNQISQSAVYKEDDVTITISVCGGSYGGGQRS